MHRQMITHLIFRMNNILIDTCYWFALYNKRDNLHNKANNLLEYLTLCRVIIPYPSLYETINTRFAKNTEELKNFKNLLQNNNFSLIDDDDYKADALELSFSSALVLNRPLSLIDIIIRQMLSDKKLNINYLISFNVADFIDVCTKHKIEILSE